MATKAVKDFSLPATGGKTFKLSEAKAKFLVIYFYPKDNTPGCTTEACGFRDQQKDFSKKKAVILGVSADGVASHEKFKKKYGLPFQLLSDPEKNVIQSYGVWKEKNMYGKVSMGVVRTTFLIDEKGIVSKVWNNVKVDGHVEAVLSAIEGK